MRPRALAALVVSLLLCSLAAGTTAGEQATVSRVVDGDTLVVQIGAREDKVRLIGVNTPESVHPRRPVEAYSKEASAFTRRLAQGKKVRLLGEAGTLNRDKYSRLLRYVFLPDGVLLNAEIIRQGYGHADLRYPFAKMEEFRALEREARGRGLGLWAASAPAPAVTTGTTAARPASAAAYVGSLRSRVYHRESCEWALKISAQNRILFKNVEEAREAGFTPCRICLPPAAKTAVPAAR